MTIAELQRLSGISETSKQQGINVSVSGTALRKKERELGLRPGDPDWFKLWFSRPYWTGFPTGFRSRKLK